MVCDPRDCEESFMCPNCPDPRSKTEKKRTWVYVQQPSSYGISCDKCGGPVQWSEWEKKVWCPECKIDTRGNEGIFGGPIPLELSKILGISFDKYFFRDKNIRKMQIKGDKLVWRKERKVKP